MIISNTSNNVPCLCLMPNRSASWFQTKVLIGLISLVAALVAIFWWWLGVWIILPFAGGEILLLWWLSIRVCAATYRWQKLLFYDDVIEVQWGKVRIDLRRRLARGRSRVVLQHPRHSLSAGQVRLTDNTQSFAIGECLNREDVSLLVDELRKLGMTIEVQGEVQRVALEPWEDQY